MSNQNGRVADIVEIDLALGRIRRSMARQSLSRRVLRDLGVDVDSSLIESLHAIDGAERASPGAAAAIGTVATILGVDPSQASRMVAEGVRLGYIERVASKNDGRRSALQLSPTGHALFDAFQRQKRSIMEHHFNEWSAADLADFARLLTRFSTIARPDG